MTKVLSHTRVIADAKPRVVDPTSFKYSVQLNFINQSKDIPQYGTRPERRIKLPVGSETNVDFLNKPHPHAFVASNPVQLEAKHHALNHSTLHTPNLHLKNAWLGPLLLPPLSPPSLRCPRLDNLYPTPRPKIRSPSPFLALLPPLSQVPLRLRRQWRWGCLRQPSLTALKQPHRMDQRQNQYLTKGPE